MQKILGSAKMGRTSSICVQSVMGIGGRMAMGDKNYRCFWFFVTLLEMEVAHHNVWPFNEV